MVLTVEPGIYVRPGAGVPEQFWHTASASRTTCWSRRKATSPQHGAKSVAEIEQLMSQD
jgi:Xaa-Pro aminopeptidase